MWLFPALLLLLPGCCTAWDATTGPVTVRGQEQGSLTVQCRYDPYWKRYKKYWCRGPVWKSCEILVLSDTMERLVKKNRVSIRDDQTGFIVTVTMEELRMSDADTYWCAIERTGFDPNFEVGVSIDPAPVHSTTTETQEESTLITKTIATDLTSTPTTMANTGKQQVTQTSPFTWSPCRQGLQSAEEENEDLRAVDASERLVTHEGVQRISQHPIAAVRSLLSSTYFLLLVFLELPLLLSMLTAVLWVTLSQR